MGAWGNFVNRTLAFVLKYFDCEVPSALIQAEFKKQVQGLFHSVGVELERGAFREAIREIFQAIHRGNAFYDAEQPWKTRHTDLKKCRETIGNCIYLIANLAVLLHPFLPFSSEKIAKWLGVTFQWGEQEVSLKQLPSDISILFSRLE